MLFDVQSILEKAFVEALESLGYTDVNPIVVLATKPQFGDFQANGVLPLAKKLKVAPRQLAEQVMEACQLNDVIERMEVAGPGFINIFVANAFLSDCLNRQSDCIEVVSVSKRIVIDYSSPNLAKSMHVGHLRSTIIGDAIARMLEALGHEVIRQNHVGDWGTQFGMLLTYMQDNAKDADDVADLEVFYQQAKQAFDASEDFQRRSREAVVALQAKQEPYLGYWKKFTKVSHRHMFAIYDKLGVSLKEEHIYGESAFNEQLPKVIEALDAKKLTEVSDGALCVFSQSLRGKNGKYLPTIVRKADGGYLYATTDLAALHYRSLELKADQIIYVVGGEQALHFDQVFEVARLGGLVAEACELKVYTFGAMLNENGKPFKTREGGTVKLAALLDEAASRAEGIVRLKQSNFSQQEIEHLAKVVGIGAVKYADLSKTRTKNYEFIWDCMLSFDGNTAPYLQYAYTRIVSLFRKVNLDIEHQLDHELVIEASEEHAVALLLLRFQRVVEAAAESGQPHQLCQYLFDLSRAFMLFYEGCSIHGAEVSVRQSRLVISQKVAQVLKFGLGLLGINVVEKM